MATFTLRIFGLTTGKVPILTAFSLCLLCVASCGADSKNREALTQSRNEVIAAARKIRHDSRAHTRPSEGFFGNFYRCPTGNGIHYSLETDWITPRNDADDLRQFGNVVKALQSDGWVASSVTPQRVETMRRRHLEIRISVNPGALWITGIIGGPCYKPGEKADSFLDRAADQLSG